MAMNLLTIVENQFSGNLLKKVSDYLEEDIMATQKTMDVALPAVLSGLTNSAISQNGAETLHNTLAANKHEGNIIYGLNILLGGGSATQGLINYGEKINSSLFGNKQSAIVDWIASYSGIKTSSASGLMNMITPVALDIIGKEVLGKNTGATGLAKLLGDQTDFLKKALPTGLISVLGLKNLNLGTPSVVETVTAAKKQLDAASVVDEKPFINRLLPWLILLGVGVAGLMYLRSCNTRGPQPPATTTISFDALPTLKVDSVKSIALPNIGDLKVKSGSFIDKLNTAITDTKLDPTKALTFDNVNFATGSADLTEGSKTQLGDLVKVMNAYPKVEIKIEGHTDNVGQEEKNKALSEARAVSVKKYLLDNGIDSARIATAGFGMAKPIADNNTAEGKAKNRRIEAFIVKK